MALPKYQTELLKLSEYEEYLKFLDVAYACKFQSSGKSGNFQLRIFITRPKYYTEHYYNLGFGAWDPGSFTVDDIVELRNGDSEQILATIVDTALDFLESNPFASLYAEGSTRARTRLYQREIAKHLHFIPRNIRIYGLVKENDVGFIEFRTGVNFDAFLLSVK